MENFQGVLFVPLVKILFIMSWPRFVMNYLRQTNRYCPAGFVDSFDGTGRFKPDEWRRLVEAQGNGCLTDIPNVRGSRYAGNAIEM